MDEHVTYRQQVHFCGKPRCRKCRDGIGHGPYWYAYHLTPEGRTVRTYIGRHLPADAVQAAESPTSSTATKSPSSHIYKPDALPTSRGEIDGPERLLASDPTNEAALQALMIALAKAKRRGEAMRAYQRFTSTSRTALSSRTQDIYDAIQRGDDPTNLGSRGGSGEDEGRGRLRRPSPATSEGRLRRPSPATSEPEPRVGRGNQSPLVGRDAEREALRQLLLAAEQEQLQGRVGKRAIADKQTETTSVQALAVAGTRPRCVVLMGESGIGKTRLVEETARDALRVGWSVVWSHAYAQESGIPYRMWSETLRNIIAQGFWEPMQADQPHLYSPLLALLPELRDEWEEGERVGSGSYHHNPRSPEQEQVQLREALYELLAAVSARAPLLLALDDVQWADGSSCEMLGYLARRLNGLPIALLATCRENELASNETLRQLLSHMQREHAVEYLHVKPLTDAEIAALVAHLPGALVRRIQSQAAGNPFFAEELANSLHGQARNHIDSKQQGRAEPVEAGQKKDRYAKETAALPTSITGALNSRMQRLSNACRHLLDKASVLGGSFGLPLIVEMEADHADEEAVLDLLDEALHAGVLTEEGAGTRVTYRFWHPLLASHLYSALSQTRRQRLHRQAAGVMQATYLARGNALNEQAATITDHLVKGGGEAAQIASFAEMAANYAYSLSAYPEAEQHYRLAVQSLEAADPQHGRETPGKRIPEEARARLAFLLERLAECERIQGRFTEARALFERVLEVRNPEQEVPLDAQEAQIQALLWSEIGWTWRYTGDSERAWQGYERGEQVLRDASISSGPARARLLFQQSSLHWQEGHYEEAMRAAREALSMFEEAQSAQGIPSALNVQQGQSQQAAEGSARLTRIRNTLLGDPVDLGRTHALLGAIANDTGQRDVALQHLNTALGYYERYGRLREIAHVCNNIGHVYMKLGRYTQARSDLQRAYNLAERTGDTPLMSVVMHNLAELAYASGEGSQQEAEDFYKHSLHLAEQINDRVYLSHWNAEYALLLLRRGDLNSAAPHIRLALSIARAIHNMPCTGLALVALGAFRLAQAAHCNDGHEAAYRRRARHTLQHALTLPGLEVETRTIGQQTLQEA